MVSGFLSLLRNAKSGQGFFRCERILSTANRNLGVTEFFPPAQLHCFEAQEFFRYANGA